jgi:hypothetical protein
MSYRRYEMVPIQKIDKNKDKENFKDGIVMAKDYNYHAGRGVEGWDNPAVKEICLSSGRYHRT